MQTWFRTVMAVYFVSSLYFTQAQSLLPPGKKSAINTSSKQARTAFLQSSGFSPTNSNSSHSFHLVENSESRQVNMTTLWSNKLTIDSPKDNLVYNRLAEIVNLYENSRNGRKRKIISDQVKFDTFDQTWFRSIRKKSRSKRDISREKSSYVEKNRQLNRQVGSFSTNRMFKIRKQYDGIKHQSNQGGKKKQRYSVFTPLQYATAQKAIGENLGIFETIGKKLQFGENRKSKQVSQVINVPNYFQNIPVENPKAKTQIWQDTEIAGRNSDESANIHQSEQDESSKLSDHYPYENFLLSQPRSKFLAGLKLRDECLEKSAKDVAMQDKHHEFIGASAHSMNSLRSKNIKRTPTNKKKRSNTNKFQSWSPRLDKKRSDKVMRQSIKNQFGNRKRTRRKNQKYSASGRHHQTSQQSRKKFVAKPEKEIDNFSHSKVAEMAIDGGKQRKKQTHVSAKKRKSKLKRINLKKNVTLIKKKKSKKTPNSFFRRWKNRFLPKNFKKFKARAKGLASTKRKSNRIAKGKIKQAKHFISEDEIEQAEYEAFGSDYRLSKKAKIQQEKARKQFKNRKFHVKKKVVGKNRIKKSNDETNKIQIKNEAKNSKRNEKRSDPILHDKSSDKSMVTKNLGKFRKKNEVSVETNEEGEKVVDRSSEELKNVPLAKDEIDGNERDKMNKWHGGANYNPFQKSQLNPSRNAYNIPYHWDEVKKNSYYNPYRKPYLTPLEDAKYNSFEESQYNPYEKDQVNTIVESRQNVFEQSPFEPISSLNQMSFGNRENLNVDTIGDDVMSDPTKFASSNKNFEAKMKEENSKFDRGEFVENPYKFGNNELAEYSLEQAFNGFEDDQSERANQGSSRQIDDYQKQAFEKNNLLQNQIRSPDENMKNIFSIEPVEIFANQPESLHWLSEKQPEKFQESSFLQSKPVIAPNKYLKQDNNKDQDVTYIIIQEPLPQSSLIQNVKENSSPFQEYYANNQLKRLSNQDASRATANLFLQEAADQKDQMAFHQLSADPYNIPSTDLQKYKLENKKINSIFELDKSRFNDLQETKSQVVEERSKPKGLVYSAEDLPQFDIEETLEHHVYGKMPQKSFIKSPREYLSKKRFWYASPKTHQISKNSIVTSLAKSQSKNSNEFNKQRFETGRKKNSLKRLKKSNWWMGKKSAQESDSSECDIPAALPVPNVAKVEIEKLTEESIDECVTVKPLYDDECEEVEEKKEIEIKADEEDECIDEIIEVKEPKVKPTEEKEKKPATKPEAKPEEKPAAKPEEKPAAKPEEKPAAEPQEKPAAKHEKKPAAKPKKKPTAKHEKKPTTKPQKKPTTAECVEKPIAKPKKKPTPKPEKKPAAEPEKKPAAEPEKKPAAEPEKKPAAEPEKKPAAKPEKKPAAKHGKKPTTKPKKKTTTAECVEKPIAQPETKPAAEPEKKPAAKPEKKPAAKPEKKPAAESEKKPTSKPEKKPAAKPEKKPAAKPEKKPAAKPEKKPAEKPEKKPTTKPKKKPTTAECVEKPAAKPEKKPAAKPEKKPAAKPEKKPAAKPEKKPAVKPEKKPTTKPKKKPTTAECVEKPIAQPKKKPAAKPEKKPAAKPEKKPASKPEKKPAEKPEKKPTTKPKKKTTTAECVEKPITQPKKKPAAKPEKKPAAKPEKKPAAKPTKKPSTKSQKKTTTAECAEKPISKPKKKPAPKPKKKPTPKPKKKPTHKPKKPEKKKPSDKHKKKKPSEKLKPEEICVEQTTKAFDECEEMTTTAEDTCEEITTEEADQECKEVTVKAAEETTIKVIDECEEMTPEVVDVECEEMTHEVVDVECVETTTVDKCAEITTIDECIDITTTDKCVEITTTDKCVETSTKDKCIEMTTTKTCEEITSTDECIAITTTDKCVEVTTTDKCVEVTTTDKCAEITTTDKCLEITTADECGEITTTNKCIETTATDKCIEMTTTNKCVETTTTDKCVETTTTDKCVETTTTDKCVETSTTEKCIEMTTTEKCIEMTTTEKCIEMTTTEKCIEMTTTEKCIEMTTTDKCVEITTTDKCLEITTADECVEITTTDKCVETTTKDKCIEMTTTEKCIEMTTTEKCIEMTTTEKCVEVTTADECVEITSTDKCVETTSADKCIETTTTDKCVETTTTDKCVETTTKDKCIEMTTTEKCREVTAADECIAITITDKCDEITTIDECGEITTTNKCIETTTTDKCIEMTTTDNCITTTADKCAEITTTDKCVEITTTDECVELTTTDKCVEITTTNECVEITTTDKCVEITTTDKCIDMTTIDKCVEITTTDECVDITTIDECLETTTTDKCIETTPTDNCVETTTTDKCIETTPTDNCVETTTTNKCVEVTTTDNCVETTTTDKCIEITTTDKCVEITTTDKCVEITTADVDECVDITTTDKCVEITTTDKCVELTTTDNCVEITTTDKCVDITTTDKCVDISTTDKCLEITTVDKCVEITTTNKCAEITTTDKCVEITTTDKCAEIATTDKCAEITTNGKSIDMTTKCIEEKLTKSNYEGCNDDIVKKIDRVIAKLRENKGNGTEWCECKKVKNYKRKGEITCEPTTPIKCEPTTPIKCDPTTPIKCEPTTPIKCQPTTPIKCEPTTPIKCESTTPIKCEPTTPIKSIATIPMQPICELPTQTTCKPSTQSTCGDKVVEEIAVDEACAVVTCQPPEIIDNCDDKIAQTTCNPTEIIEIFEEEVMDEESDDDKLIEKRHNKEKNAHVFRKDKFVNNGKKREQYKKSSRELKLKKESKLNKVYVDDNVRSNSRRFSSENAKLGRKKRKRIVGRPIGMTKRRKQISVKRRQVLIPRNVDSHFYSLRDAMKEANKNEYDENFAVASLSKQISNKARMDQHEKYETGKEKAHDFSEMAIGYRKVRDVSDNDKVNKYENDILARFLKEKRNVDTKKVRTRHTNELKVRKRTGDSEAERAVGCMKRSHLSINKRKSINEEEKENPSAEFVAGMNRGDTKGYLPSKHSKNSIFNAKSYQDRHLGIGSQHECEKPISKDSSFQMGYAQPGQECEDDFPDYPDTTTELFTTTTTTEEPCQFHKEGRPVHYVSRSEVDNLISPKLDGCVLTLGNVKVDADSIYLHRILNQYYYDILVWDVAAMTDSKSKCTLYRQFNRNMCVLLTQYFKTVGTQNEGQPEVARKHYFLRRLKKIVHDHRNSEFPDPSIFPTDEKVYVGHCIKYTSYEFLQLHSTHPMAINSGPLNIPKIMEWRKYGCGEFFDYADKNIAPEDDNQGINIAPPTILYDKRVKFFGPKVYSEGELYRGRKLLKYYQCMILKIASIPRRGEKLCYFSQFHRRFLHFVKRYRHKLRRKPWKKVNEALAWFTHRKLDSLKGQSANHWSSDRKKLIKLTEEIVTEGVHIVGSFTGLFSFFGKLVGHYPKQKLVALLGSVLLMLFLTIISGYNLYCSLQRKKRLALNCQSKQSSDPCEGSPG